jgi:hypothetical protein
VGRPPADDADGNPSEGPAPGPVESESEIGNGNGQHEAEAEDGDEDDQRPGVKHPETDAMDESRAEVVGLIEDEGWQADASRQSPGPGAEIGVSPHVSKCGRTNASDGQTS